MEIDLIEVFPMDKGTSVATDYDFDDNEIKHRMKNDHLDDCFIGLIHSHNKMGVFFSGTDMSELEDNAPNHNFYLSLIVNNALDYCAKVCFVAVADKNEYNLPFTAKDESGSTYVLENIGFQPVKDKLVIINCDVVYPDEGITEDFLEAVEDISTYKPYVAPGYRHYSTYKHYPSKVGDRSIANRVSTNTKKNSKGKVFRYIGPEVKGEKELEDNFQEYIRKQFEQYEDEEVEDKQQYLSSNSYKFDDEVEAFTLFLLNMGNPLKDEVFIDEVLDNDRNADKSGEEIAEDILKEYGRLYEQFFKGYFNNQDIYIFKDVLDCIINDLEAEYETSIDPKGVISKLKPIIEALKEYYMDYRRTKKL